ncbi:MAG: hypothetical protein JNK60_05930, partial [Acidobacteria bacterium]|nr:hypothetical protein [Acidobacteriota bacterium]
GTMAVEIPLWEAVLAVAHDPASAEARQLLATLAASSGYRVERLPANPHASDAANRLREDPDDVAALLRLAKAARIDRDFLRMMRLFHRLREIPVGDPYLEGQIASLVARDRPPSQPRVTAVPGVPAGPAAPAPRDAPTVQSPPAVAPRSTVKPGPSKSRPGPVALDVARQAVTILVATPHLVAATLIGLALLIAGLTRLF